MHRAWGDFQTREDFDEIPEQICDELDDALRALDAEVPSLNTLTSRLRDKINAYLAEHDIPLELNFDIVDYDLNTDGMQTAVVLSMLFQKADGEPLLEYSFAPKLPGLSLGPVGLGVGFSADFVGDASLQIRRGREPGGPRRRADFPDRQ